MLLNYTGERAVPHRTPTDVMGPHVMRYAWALQWVTNCDVVDLACGAGYGSLMLSWVARSVLGMDIDEDAVLFATHTYRYRSPGLHFVMGDMTAEVPDADIYVAFECLEHVEDPADVLALTAGRPLIWSMPVNNANPPHVRPYSVGDIEALMDSEQLFYQDARGYIYRRGECRPGFMPSYVLGVKAA